MKGRPSVAMAVIAAVMSTAVSSNPPIAGWKNVSVTTR
jgi:hypothetical protein